MDWNLWSDTPCSPTRGAADSIVYAHSAGPKSLNCGIVGCGCGCGYVCVCVCFYSRGSRGGQQINQKDPFLNLCSAHLGAGGTKRIIKKNSKHAKQINANMNN